MQMNGRLRWWGVLYKTLGSVNPVACFISQDRTRSSTALTKVVVYAVESSLY